MNVQLTFINQSNDANNSQIVIFQKNTPTDANEIAVAWTVIENCGQGCSHPFTYPLDSTIGYADSWGNYTPQLSAQPGQLFSAIKANSGDEIQLTGTSDSPAEIELANALPQGAVEARIYKDGRLFAKRAGVAPGQKAAFEFQPTIWIGVVSQVEQGQVMDEAIVSSVDTEISLLGIASADIVMTGGGVGSDAEPFQFTLQHVVMA